MIMTTSSNGVVYCEMASGRIGTIHKLQRAFAVKYDGQEELLVCEREAIRWMKNKDLDERKEGCSHA